MKLKMRVVIFTTNKLNNPLAHLRLYKITKSTQRTAAQTDCGPSC